MQDQLNFQKDSCCFTCLLPTRLCKSLVEQENSEKCLFSTILPALFALFARNDQGIYPITLEVLGEEYSSLQILGRAQKLLEWEWGNLDTEQVLGIKVFQQCLQSIE